MSAAFWTCAVITTVSALVSGGYSVVGLRAATPESRSPSMYALSRSVALLAVTIIGLFSSSIAFVAAAAVVMTLVQAFDAVIGGIVHDRLKTFGPAATAVANAAALVWMIAS